MKAIKRKGSIFSGRWPTVYISAVLAISFLVAAVVAYTLFTTSDINAEIQLAMGIAVALVIAALAVSFSVIRIREETRSLRNNFDSLKASYDETLLLNDKLREQRHDFLNHIQVVHSLIEMKNFEEASRYMEKVYDDIQLVGKVMKTRSPAVNALLQVKNNSCEKHGIDFKILSTTRLSSPAMEAWDICAILGNLIDNSIHAVSKTNNGKILVSMRESLDNYIFKVKDNGIGIPSEIAEKVFDMGFTTKGEFGQGIGLAVSKKKLVENGGDIRFTTGSKGTIFTFTVPKAEENISDAV
ncbi:MAG: Spo0B domain-containing protein [Clostridia bacterium]|nr:Spo0B domain-containing protein [Clostridia bacterium]MBN2882497.1 Spo0B domain-containing protein [Clostridia bacterium]